jgi:hypothetical protein
MRHSVLTSCPTCGDQFRVTADAVRRELVVACPDGHHIQLRNDTPAALKARSSPHPPQAPGPALSPPKRQLPH